MHVTLAVPRAPHGGAKHSGTSLNVQPEAPVLILVVPEVPQRLMLVGWAEDL